MVVKGVNTPGPQRVPGTDGTAPGTIQENIGNLTLVMQIRMVTILTSVNGGLGSRSATGGRTVHYLFMRLKPWQKDYFLKINLTKYQCMALQKDKSDISRRCPSHVYNIMDITENNIIKLWLIIEECYPQ